MSRNYKTQLKFQENQSYHKDHVISTLKRQLFQLKDLQHDFMRLNDDVSGLQSKYALMLDEKERSQNQHKMKIEITKKNLFDLRNDVDSLKMQIHKMSVQIDDTSRQNSTLKRMCDNRQGQITSMMASNREIEKGNQIQLQQNKNLTHTLKNLKQQRNRSEQESQRLNKILDESINTLKQLQKQARQLQISNSKLDYILNQAEKDHNNLLGQMKNKQIQVQKINKDLKQLNEQTEDLRQTNNKLQRQCHKSQQQYKELSTKLDISCTKNKQISQKLKSLQNNLRTTQTELDQSVIKRQNLRKQHNDLANQNKMLNGEIDQCLMSILDFQRINKTLKKQVENYISCDEEVRSMLNRKQAMRGLLEQVTIKLSKTEEQIAHLR